MEFLGALREASIMALLSILVTLFPMAAGLSYLLKPGEQRLALVRPVSLAGIFAGIGGTVLGFINVLRGYWIHQPPPEFRIAAVGMAEALVPLFVVCGSLTVAWLCVAIGMRRGTSS